MQKREVSRRRREFWQALHCSLWDYPSLQQGCAFTHFAIVGNLARPRLQQGCAFTPNVDAGSLTRLPFPRTQEIQAKVLLVDLLHASLCRHANERGIKKKTWVLASFALLAVRLSKSTARMCLYVLCNCGKSRQTKSTPRTGLHSKCRRWNSRQTPIPTNSIDIGQAWPCRLATRFSM
jgi:hypothetical protein